MCLFLPPSPPFFPPSFFFPFLSSPPFFPPSYFFPPLFAIPLTAASILMAADLYNAPYLKQCVINVITQYVPLSPSLTPLFSTLLLFSFSFLSSLFSPFLLFSSSFRYPPHRRVDPDGRRPVQRALPQAMRH